jgi:two-component sensor histidine kinase
VPVLLLRLQEGAVMTPTQIPSSSDKRTRRVSPPGCDNDLLLREVVHRCVNDLQLVVSLLALQSRRAVSIEAQQALNETMGRVAILADARSYLLKEARPTLELALQAVGNALRSQAEPRGIVLQVDVPELASGLSTNQITTLALVVNELATNAIKHAFAKDCGGHVTIFARPLDTLTLSIGVDDNGCAFPGVDERRRDGLGLSLARRLVDSIGALLIMPAPGSKRIEVRVAVRDV